MQEYKSELEQKLELVFEDTRYALSRRRYFGTEIISRTIVKNTLQNALEKVMKERGPQIQDLSALINDPDLYDEVTRRVQGKINDPVLVEEVLDEMRLRLLNGTTTDPELREYHAMLLYSDDKNEDFLVYRQSDRSQPIGVRYFIEPTDKDQKTMKRIDADSRIEVINGLINKGRYKFEGMQLFSGEAGLSVAIYSQDARTRNGVIGSHRFHINVTGRGDKRREFSVFQELHGQRARINELMKRITFVLPNLS